MRYADLPSSPGIFPTPLLDSALTKMRAASNDALVQWTLHPLKIPQKSSASSADRGSVSPVVPRSRQQASTNPFSSSSQCGQKKRGNKGKAPFSEASDGSGLSRGKQKGAGKKSSWQGFASVAGGGLSVGALEALAVLGASHLAGRLSHPLLGLSSSPLSHPNVVSDVSGRISSCTGLVPGGREDAVKDAFEIVLDPGPGF